VQPCFVPSFAADFADAKQPSLLMAPFEQAAEKSHHFFSTITLRIEPSILNGYHPLRDVASDGLGFRWLCIVVARGCCLSEFELTECDD
jgi:hypothetical protein